MLLMNIRLSKLKSLININDILLKNKILKKLHNAYGNYNTETYFRSVNKILNKKTILQSDFDKLSEDNKTDSVERITLLIDELVTLTNEIKSFIENNNNSFLKDLKLLEEIILKYSESYDKLLDNNFVKLDTLNTIILNITHVLKDYRNISFYDVYKKIRTYPDIENTNLTDFLSKEAIDKLEKAGVVINESDSVEEIKMLNTNNSENTTLKNMDYTISNFKQVYHLIQIMNKNILFIEKITTHLSDIKRDYPDDTKEMLICFSKFLTVYHQVISNAIFYENYFFNLLKNLNEELQEGVR